MSNLTEDIFEAINIIASAKLKEISYDTTKICTIVDDTNKKEGKYIVTDGAIKFEAYSESTKYRINDAVRVSVPNGDFTQSKYIVGKYAAEEVYIPLTYVSPLESMVDMTDNIIPEEQANGNYSLKANGNVKERTIWSADLSKMGYADLQNNGIYNVLSLKGDFKCMLADYAMRGGTYGLKLDLYIPTEDKTGYIKQTADLGILDMFGDPYSFLIYSTQEKKFDISTLGTIEKVRLYLYQNQDFKYYNGKETLLFDEDFFLFDNIFVQNVYMGFGSELSKVEDNTVQLYTTGDSFYRLGGDAETNEKQIGLLWYNKTDENKYIGFSDGIYDPTYDELYYLNESSFDSRLTAQIGRDVPTDESGLELSADIEEAIPLFAEISTLVTKDLRNTLRAFNERVAGIHDVIVQSGLTVEQVINELIKNEGILEITAKNLDSYTEVLNNYYSKVLSAASALQKGEEVDYEDDINGRAALNNLYDVLDNLEESIYQEDYFLKEIYDIIQNPYSGFLGIYDTYRIRVNKIMSTIGKNREKISNLLDDNQDKLDAFFKEGYVFEEYAQTDFSNYANKYCIYWYRYVPGYVDENERFMDKEWRRLTEYNNYGLPKDYTEIDGIKYLKKKPDAGEGLITRFMEGTRQNEKYVAVLFYNHEMFKSEPLEFTNQDEVLDSSLIDATDAIVIEHGKDSRDNYQLYGVDNQLINSAERCKKRQLKLTYQGLILGDEALINTQIYWYVPNNATMITWAAEDLEGFSNDLSSASTGRVSEHYKEGFTCFYRTINADENDDLISEERLFTYRIKNYFVPTSSNNTIYCKIVKGEYVFETEILLNFNSYGTSGTDYTLVIQPAGSQNAVYAGQGLELEIALFNYNNEQIPIYVNKPDDFSKGECSYGLELEFVGPSGYSADLIESNGQYIGAIAVLEQQSYVNEPYGILKAVTTVSIATEDDSRTVDLTTLYSIPYSSGDYYIEGANIVVYDSSGSNPTYYKDAYKIYNDATDIEIENVSWSIVNYDAKGKVITQGIELSYAPVLNKKGGLTPSTLYLENSGVYPVVLCKDKSNVVIWAQPIVLMQNRYPSPMLNSWDGGLVIDEENGTIMSTMVGAGRKNSDNQFEGVLMGDVAAGAGFDPDNGSGIGLYGFHDGAQSFAFLSNGTGFIGKSGRGRIHLDGNKSTLTSASFQAGGEGLFIDLDSSPYLIARNKNAKNLIYLGDNTYYLQSSNYDNDSDGMLIDLQEGHIDAYNFKLTSGFLTINSNGYPYFRITNNDGNIINITKNNFIIQSPNFNQGEGLQIDLSDGSIEAYDFVLKAGDALLIRSDGNPYLSIKNGTNPLLYVSKNEFLLQSNDWLDGSSGTQINLVKGSIKSYNFLLEASGKNGDIIINSNATDYPLSINDNSFRVKWDGSIEAKTATFYSNINMAGASIIFKNDTNTSPIGTLSAKVLPALGKTLEWGGEFFKVDTLVVGAIQASGDRVNIDSANIDTLYVGGDWTPFDTLINSKIAGLIEQINDLRSDFDNTIKSQAATIESQASTISSLNNEIDSLETDLASAQMDRDYYYDEWQIEYNNRVALEEENQELKDKIAELEGGTTT